MKNEKHKLLLVSAFSNLLQVSNIRPYLFRTRLERILIRTIAYAEETGEKELLSIAISTKDKLLNIVDKSNHTSDGILRSYELLKPNFISIQNLLEPNK